MVMATRDDVPVVLSWKERAFLGALLPSSNFGRSSFLGLGVGLPAAWAGRACVACGCDDARVHWLWLSSVIHSVLSLCNTVCSGKHVLYSNSLGWPHQTSTRISFVPQFLKMFITRPLGEIKPDPDTKRRKGAC